MLKTKKKKKIF